MRGFATACAFLTAIPVPARWQDADLRRAVRWYPAVGLLLGVIFMASGWCLAGRVPPLIGAVLLATLPWALTRCFHADGLADSFDALLSHRDRERKLAIMHDSRIGTMGGCALIASFALTVACLAELLQDPLRWTWPLPPLAVALVATPLLGRALIAGHMALLPYARHDSSLGTRNWNRAPTTAALHLLLAAALSLALDPLTGGLALGAAVLAALAWAACCRRAFGGGTGDTAGAGVELVGLAVLLACALRSGIASAAAG